MSFSLLSEPSLAPRPIPSQNVADRLFHRSLYGMDGMKRKVRGALDTNRAFYTNVYPNMTLVNINKPNCYLRKFTPDGKRFIAFSHCQTQLEIYVYKGPSAANEIIENYWNRRDEGHADDMFLCQQVRYNRFQ